MPLPPKFEIATLAGGCFWCLEAVFARLRGVEKVMSGYMGGHLPNPGYKSVCTGNTGHAEVVQVTYDPALISFDDLLKVFFAIHDPTTLNQQGNDRGTQYRSAIFWHTQEQKTQAEASIKREQVNWPDPIVTEVTEAKAFYPAESYHQDYYANNPYQPYCQFVVAPKVRKALEKFGDKIKG
ncbi:MAG: peptide-methionine (S)-S-oxide reductase MsrA [Hydrogenophilaceae bacterium]|nr:peptide-methionine (S)-S-oxide reductase MsrA [Hydrogenophilaceae bacterium]